MEPIVVVTGLPRSGTSMLMQMLEAGGLPIYSDALRAADEDNPKGYFEHAAVKRLGTDATWMADAAGRAIKVVVPLVMHLPAGLEYRVILVERDLDEVLASQGKMIARNQTAGASLPVDRLRAVFDQQIGRARHELQSRSDVQLLVVEYHQVVEQAADTAATIAGFLGDGLDVRAMAAAVDPTLYRNRGG